MLSNKIWLFVASFTIISIIVVLLVAVYTACYIGNLPELNFYSLEQSEYLEKNVISEFINRYNRHLSSEQRLVICDTIFNEAITNGLDPFFVASVIAAESSFRPNVVSHCAARGLMQVTTVVMKMMKVNNPFDIKQNIYAGTQYLKKLQRQFDKEELVLAAYNAGPTRVARLKRIPRIKETMNYVKKITILKQRLKSGLALKINQQFNRISLSPLLQQMANKDNYNNSSLKSGYKFSFSRSLADLCEPQRALIFFYA